jgi:predicted nucleotide-binding protein (sugar kinase/HSP70/actin superfamily)
MMQANIILEIWSSKSYKKANNGFKNLMKHLDKISKEFVNLVGQDQT